MEIFTIETTHLRAYALSTVLMTKRKRRGRGWDHDKKIRFPSMGNRIIKRTWNVLSPYFHTRSVNGPYYYQLAFLTPGMRPAEAISRNWIREIPN